MIKDKLKGLIKLTGKNQTELAKKRGVSPAQFNLKITRGAFRIDDLIELANDTNTTLVFLNKKGNPVVQFDMDDIKW